MVNEVKYSEFTITGEVKETITLNEFIRLYVNHRPVVGVNKPQVRLSGQRRVIMESPWCVRG